MIGGSMLRRGQTTTFPERLDITERAAAGQSDPEIAAELGCSVWTVRKWRRRGQHQGRAGLSSQMGRHATGLLATLPTGMRETIVQMRRAHPGWGPTTLLAELQVDPRWTDQPLPSRYRIAALLKGEHLTRRYQKHSDLPIPVIQPEGAPHDEWELDAQGTMTLQALLGQRWSDQTALWAGLDARRAMLNQHIPSTVFQGRPPLQAYPEAAHSGRFYRPEWEAQMLELHFDADQGCFLGQLADSETTVTFAPQGLTKTDLMGELGHLLALPAYQLALPFTHEAWRLLEYTRVLAGTTL